MSISDGQQLPHPHSVSAPELGRVLAGIAHIGPELIADPVTLDLRLAQLHRAATLGRWITEAAEHQLHHELRTSADQPETSMTLPPYDAPSHDEAYAQAPDLDTEITNLRHLRDDLDPDRRPAHYPPVSQYDQREILLRQAAANDRLLQAHRALGNGDEAPLLLAESSAADLLQHDLDHGADVAGPHGPDSAQWHRPDGARAYVRQEYLAWLTRPDVPDLYEL